MWEAPQAPAHPPPSRGSCSSEVTLGEVKAEDQEGAGAAGGGREAAGDELTCPPVDAGCGGKETHHPASPPHMKLSLQDAGNLSQKY